MGVGLIIIIIILVSAAKRIDLDLLLMTLGKSLMYNRRSRSPNIEP
jgi:hypothetical protein